MLYASFGHGCGFVTMSSMMSCHCCWSCRSYCCCCQHLMSWNCCWTSLKTDCEQIACFLALVCHHEVLVDAQEPGHQAGGEHRLGCRGLPRGQLALYQHGGELALVLSTTSYHWSQAQARRQMFSMIDSTRQHLPALHQQTAQRLLQFASLLSALLR